MSTSGDGRTSRLLNAHLLVDMSVHEVANRQRARNVNSLIPTSKNGAVGRFSIIDLLPHLELTHHAIDRFLNALMRSAVRNDDTSFGGVSPWLLSPTYAFVPMSLKTDEEKALLARNKALAERLGISHGKHDIWVPCGDQHGNGDVFTCAREGNIDRLRHLIEVEAFVACVQSCQSCHNATAEIYLPCR